MTELEVARRQRDDADLRAASLEEEVRTPCIFMVWPASGQSDAPERCHRALCMRPAPEYYAAIPASSSDAGAEVRGGAGRDQRGGQGAGQALAAEGGGQHEAVGGGAQGRAGALRPCCTTGVLSTTLHEGSEWCEPWFASPSAQSPALRHHHREGSILRLSMSAGRQPVAPSGSKRWLVDRTLDRPCALCDRRTRRSLWPRRTPSRR